MQFSVLLTLALLLELGGSITAFIYQDEIHDHVAKEMSKTLDDYYTDEDIRREWDDLQQDVSRFSLNVRNFNLKSLPVKTFWIFQTVHPLRQSRDARFEEAAICLRKKVLFHLGKVHKLTSGSSHLLYSMSK